VACHTPLESSQWGLKIYLRPHLNSIGSLHAKLWASKIIGIPISGILKLPFRSPRIPGQNDIWVLALWLGTKYTIRGKVVSSLKLKPSSSCHGEFCESVFTRGSSVHQKCYSYALTNLLFGLCRSMWVIELLVNLLSLHPRAPARPSTPKLLQTKECAPNSFSFYYLYLWTWRESIKELGGASSRIHGKHLWH
jgi:hypothetical protein